MKEHWESQSRLMLCVAAVGLSKNALNLALLYSKCISVSYILYASIEGIKVSGALTEKSKDNNPMSLLLLLPLASAGFGKFKVLLPVIKQDNSDGAASPMGDGSSRDTSVLLRNPWDSPWILLNSQPHQQVES